MAQSQIIRFEIVDAQRVDYQFKMKNPELQSQAERKITSLHHEKLFTGHLTGNFGKTSLVIIATRNKVPATKSTQCGGPMTPFIRKQPFVSPYSSIDGLESVGLTTNQAEAADEKRRVLKARQMDKH